MNHSSKKNFSQVNFSKSYKRDTQTDGQTDGQTDRPTDGQNRDNSVFSFGKCAKKIREISRIYSFASQSTFNSV